MASPIAGDVQLRRATAADAAECGRICFDAFAGIADQHGFPREIPAVEPAIGWLGMLFAHPSFYCVVAERDGTIVGSNCLDERNAITGVGPVTVDPAGQNRGAGRALMQAVIDRARERHAPGIRLVQSGYHCRSLSLYTKQGFAARAQLARMQGPAIASPFPGHAVRAGGAADVAACNALCAHVHGHDRAGELADAITNGALTVVERDGAIVGYSTGLSYFGHAVGAENLALMALLSDASTFDGTGFLVPTGNTELFRWCLERGLKVLQLNTLMTIGLYNEPQGAWTASILY